MEELSIDATDIKLLDALQQDASLSNQALAERVHISPPTCLRRVKRLRDARSPCSAPTSWPPCWATG